MALDDLQFAAVLADYNQRLAEENRIISNATTEIDVDSLLIPVGEDVGRLMRALIVGLDARVIVELGTSYGYSTLFLADAVKTTGGIVYSYDVAAGKQAYAKKQLARANLEDFVDFRCGDAVELLRNQPAPVDFVLMDLWKNLYVPCLARVAPLLRPGGIIVADNMVHPPQARADADAYMAAVRAMPDMQATLLPIGNGIDIAVKQGFL